LNTSPPLPALPAANLKELLALAKNGPRPLTYASGGIGSSQHLAGALFATPPFLDCTILSAP
jgi:tripartite-type tricarboxylate transporter receptor subunit TctC